MLATLNLQFLPLESTDETLATPGLTPQGEPGTGFADLLRLRADTGLPVSEIPGEFLPQSGSELPLQALPIELDATADSGISESLLTLQEMLVEGTELGADLPIHDPLIVEVPMRDPLVAAPLATAAPVVKAPDLVSATADRRDIPAALEWRPLPVGTVVRPGPETQEAVMTLTGRAEPQVPMLRERPLTVQLPPGMTPSPEADERAIPIDMPRRAEATLLPVTSTKEISEVFKAHPTVTPTVQVLGSQPNPQQTPVMLMPSSPAPADTGYAAAAQQAGDLISTPVREPAWREQIGERVLLMAANQAKTAEIRLTPAELGPLRVQVAMDDGAANVTFHAQHALTREALEQALPRLRELLAENGLSLGEANVGEQGVAEGERDKNGAALRSAGDASEILEDTNDLATTRSTVSTSSLVDTFA